MHHLHLQTKELLILISVWLESDKAELYLLCETDYYLKPQKKNK